MQVDTWADAQQFSNILDALQSESMVKIHLLYSIIGFENTFLCAIFAGMTNLHYRQSISTSWWYVSNHIKFGSPSRKTHSFSTAHVRIIWWQGQKAATQVTRQLKVPDKLTNQSGQPWQEYSGWIVAWIVGTLNTQYEVNRREINTSILINLLYIIIKNVFNLLF